MERCLSGLRCTPGTRVWMKVHREFESPPLRTKIMKLKRLTYFFILIFNLILSQSFDRMGSVSLINGSCNVENIELGRQSSPLVGNSIFNYDIISSDSDSYCEIIFDDSATRIRLDNNTTIKLIVDKYSRVIKLFKGSLFVENAKVKIKTYIQTLHNDIYVNNNKVWVSSHLDFDQIFPINSYLDIYNQFIKSNIELLPLVVYDVNKNGEVQLNNDINLPYYVIQSSQSQKKNIESIDLFLEKSDLIPKYRDSQKKNGATTNGFYFNFSTGPRYMNSETYFNIGLFPIYKYNNLTITANLDFYINREQEILEKNWLDKNNILEKFNFRYSYMDYKNSINIHAGQFEKVSFSHGYLVNKLSNSFDYPFNNFGININYKLDNDFMEFQFLIPSTRDYFRNGGIFGFHSSLFLSHKFPLTLGLGFMVDINQFSQTRYIYEFADDFSFNLDQRKIKALEFDFNFSVVKKMNLNISLYGELAGIWYPDYIHYVRNDGSGTFGNFSKASRKGTWGIMAPGIAIEFDNKHEIKLALNYNSAGYYPSYFNTNYLYNRSVYYKIDEPLSFNNQSFILLTEQIEMLNNFAINEDLTEFILPKEIYPMLFNKFNASPVRGFTIEYDYKFRNKINFSALLSRYEQNVLLSPNYVYYTIESYITIKDGYIKNISNLDFYMQNIFFIGDKDKQEFIFGCNLGIKITPIISFILDLSQVYYDSDLDGDMMNELEFLNFGLNIGANF